MNNNQFPQQPHEPQPGQYPSGQGQPQFQGGAYGDQGQQPTAPSAPQSGYGHQPMNQNPGQFTHQGSYPNQNMGGYQNQQNYPQGPPAQYPGGPQKNSSKLWLIVIGIVAAVALIGTLLYFFVIKDDNEVTIDRPTAQGGEPIDPNPIDPDPDPVDPDPDPDPDPVDPDPIDPDPIDPDPIDPDPVDPDPIDPDPVDPDPLGGGEPTNWPEHVGDLTIDSAMAGGESLTMYASSDFSTFISVVKHPAMDAGEASGNDGQWMCQEGELSMDSYQCEITMGADTFFITGNLSESELEAWGEELLNQLGY